MRRGKKICAMHPDSLELNAWKLSLSVATARKLSLSVATATVALDKPVDIMPRLWLLFFLSVRLV